MQMIRVHGTCVAIAGEGVLLRGMPGSGKSDLALRLIDGGARLVADDQTELTRRGDTITAAAPGDRVLLVTGMSGAGRSTALKSLEDIGYEAVDNLPISLLPNIVRREAAPRRPLAIGIDIRTRDFGAASFLAALDPLAGGSGIDLRVVFLDCEDELLRRRYTETRRRHPL